LQREDGDWELRTLMEQSPAGLSTSDQVALGDSEAVSDRLLTTLTSFNSQMIIPLESDDETLGTLNFAAHALNDFSLEDRQTASLLAAQMANGLRNVRLLN